MNAFSKKPSHLKAAISLHFAFHNLCRVHTSLRVTPQWKPESQITFGASKNYLGKAHKGTKERRKLHSKNNAGTDGSAPILSSGKCATTGVSSVRPRIIHLTYVKDEGELSSGLIRKREQRGIANRVRRPLRQKCSSIITLLSKVLFM